MPVPGAGTPILRSPWLGAALSGLLALGLRLLHLGEAPEFDELYHLLAAKGWLASGELRIAEGTYDRTSLFTIAVALWMGLFGDTLEAARLVSVFAGTALALAVYLWVRNVAGTPAAWIAALLVALWPDGLTISQFLRFYALHGLMFWLGAVLTYRLGTAPAFWPAAGAAVALGVAFYLQEVTVIGLVGLALWLGPMLGVRWLRGAPSSRRLVAILAVLAPALVLAVMLVRSEFGAQMMHQFRSVPLWNQDLQDAFWFYHLQLMLDYPVLWPLTAVAVLISLARRPSPTGFCTCVFTVTFLLHSFAAAKNMRYMYYAVPFLFVLWAISLAEIGPGLWRFLKTCAERILAGAGLAARSGAIASVLLVLAVALAMNGATIKVVAHLAGIHLPTNQAPADWAGARAPLASWLEEADVVLTTSELEALHFLGRYDILVSKSRLSELGLINKDFGRDPRTGRPIIGSPAAMALVIGCYPKGLLVTTTERWRDPAQLDHEVANLVVEQAREIELDARDIRAYAWSHPPDALLPAVACAELPELTSTPGS